MKNNILLFAFLIIVILSFSCSRKSTPHNNKANSQSTVDTVSTAKNSGRLPKIKTPTPEVIVVNDAAAKKTVDGRYYYDLNGKRYWRNNKDGKYYLFNKSMYNNPDFKP